MKKLVILGAGGHARSVVDIALHNADFDIVGCINPTPGDVLGIPVIGNDQDLESILSRGINHIFVALGDNRLREYMFQRAIEIGFEPVNIISQYAFLSPRVQIGKGVCIMAGAVVNVNTTIEDNCIINTHCSIDHDCYIGRSSHIAPGVSLSGTVKTGVGVHIGTGASVIDGITIGDWAYIGACAAVVQNIPEEVLAYGVPARIIKHISSRKDSKHE